MLKTVSWHWGLDLIWLIHLSVYLWVYKLLLKMGRSLPLALLASVGAPGPAFPLPCWPQWVLQDLALGCPDTKQLCWHHWWCTDCPCCQMPACLTTPSVHVHCGCSGAQRKAPVFANSRENLLGKMALLGFAVVNMWKVNISSEVYFHTVSKKNTGRRLAKSNPLMILYSSFTKCQCRWGV